MPAIIRCGLLLALSVVASAQAQDYIPDWRFNAGLFYLDAFSGSMDRYYRGERLVRLPDGDVIVAGVVPRRDGAANALGLVRYDDSGVREAWSNPGTYGVSANQYVIYDPAPAAPRSVVGVKDLVLHGNRLFVLVDVDRAPSAPMWPPPVLISGDAVDILVFDTSGAFLSATQVVATPDSPQTNDYAGGGIAVYVPDTTASSPALHLVYAGTYQPWRQLYSRIEFTRYAVGSNGTLTAQMGFVRPNPDGLCTTGHACQVSGLALGGRATPAQPPRIYLGGWHDGPGASSLDFLVARIDANGVPVTTFGTNGAASMDFPLGGLNEDTGRAIVVTPAEGAANEDTIYLAGEISGLCHRGTGLLKLRADGVPDPAFGNIGAAGRMHFFAPDAGPEQPDCPGPNTAMRVVSGLVVADGKAVIAGHRDRGNFPAETLVDAAIGVVDATTGVLATNTLVPYSEAGVRTRHSVFTDLVVAGTRRYTATGHVRIVESDGSLGEGRTQFATVRVVPDRLFADAFGSTP